MPKSNSVVSYRSMKEGTREEFLRLREVFEKFKADQPKRLMAALEQQRDSYEGDLVDKYTHSLQTATRALRAGESSEMVVAALFHDIGGMLAGENHGACAAAILAPYVSEGTRWMVEHHPVFQGYYYWHHYDMDRFARDKYRDNPFYDLTVRFCEEFDQASMDPDYDTLPIEAFESHVHEIFAREPWGAHTKGNDHGGSEDELAKAG